MCFRAPRPSMTAYIHLTSDWAVTPSGACAQHNHGAGLCLDPCLSCTGSHVRAEYRLPPLGASTTMGPGTAWILA